MVIYILVVLVVNLLLNECAVGAVTMEECLPGLKDGVCINMASEVQCNSTITSGGGAKIVCSDLNVVLECCYSCYLALIQASTARGICRSADQTVISSALSTPTSACQDALSPEECQAYGICQQSFTDCFAAQTAKEYCGATCGYCTPTA